VIAKPGLRRFGDNAPCLGNSIHLFAGISPPLWALRLCGKIGACRQIIGWRCGKSFIFVLPAACFVIQSVDFQHQAGNPTYMKTRTRIVLTLLTILFAYGAVTLWGLVESPVSGTLTAQQLNDTGQSYVAAKMVRDDFVGKTVSAICLVAVVLIWIFPKKPTKK
jgi:hypothetical protein